MSKKIMRQEKRKIGVMLKHCSHTKNSWLIIIKGQRLNFKALQVLQALFSIL